MGKKRNHVFLEEMEIRQSIKKSWGLIKRLNKNLPYH